MTNRERILKTNPYDLLLIIDSNVKEGYDECVLDALIGKFITREYCKEQHCKKCIQEWLNEEEIK